MPNQLDRRQFLTAAAAVTAAAVITPKASLAAEKKYKWSANLGKIGDLDSGDPVLVLAQFMDSEDKLMDDEKVYVRSVRSGDGFVWVVLSAICTHLKCKLNFSETKDLFICPCHKSEFTKDGEVMKKPAKKDLPNYSTHTWEEGGRLMLGRDPK